VTGRRKKRMSIAASDNGEKGKATKGNKKKSTKSGASVSASQATSGLRGTEARDLAAVILRDLRAGYGLPPLNVPYGGRANTPSGSDTSPTGTTPSYSTTTDTPAEASFRSFCAAWLGIPLPNFTTNTRTEKRITVRKFRVDEDGFESPIGEDEDDEEEEEEESAKRRSRQLSKKKVEEMFDVEWDVGVGGMAAKVGMKGLLLEGSDTLETEGAGGSDIENGDGDTRMGEVDDDEELWEKRYKSLESTLKKRSEELRVLKEAVLDIALKT